MTATVGEGFFRREEFSSEDASVTRHSLLQEGKAMLSGENALWEAKELLFYTLSITKEAYYTDPLATVSESSANRYRTLLSRRIAGEPLAYILGEWDFYGRSFTVTPDVLIPRPATESVCEAALAHLPTDATVLDLCTGSGCIGLTIALERKDTQVWMGDISSEALAIAEKNILRHRVQNATTQIMDALAPPYFFTSFDLIVTNPPYIVPEDPCLEASVAQYEPALALYGGEDGLAFYHSIATHWTTLLRPGGRLVAECGWEQADAVKAIFRHAGLVDIRVGKDASGLDRFVEARAVPPLSFN